MRSTCSMCVWRTYEQINLYGLYVGGYHYCNAYKKPITEVKVCVKYQNKAIK